MGSSSELLKNYLAHRDSLFAFVLALTHDRDVADEVFQEAGLAVAEEASRGTRVSRFMGSVRSELSEIRAVG